MGLVNRVVAPDDVLDVGAGLGGRVRPRARWWPTAWPNRPSIVAWKARWSDGLAARAGGLRRGGPHRGCGARLASFAANGPGKATFVGR